MKKKGTISISDITNLEVTRKLKSFGFSILDFVIGREKIYACDSKNNFFFWYVKAEENSLHLDHEQAILIENLEKTADSICIWQKDRKEYLLLALSSKIKGFL